MQLHGSSMLPSHFIRLDKAVVCIGLHSLGVYTAFAECGVDTDSRRL
jgi:hypothetical protein